MTPEERLAAIEDLMRRFVDELTFNSAVVLETARRSGVDLPFDIDQINAKAAELRERVDAAFADPESEAEPPCPRGKQ